MPFSQCYILCFFSHDIYVVFNNFIFLYGVLSYALHFFFQYPRCFCFNLHSKPLFRFNYPIDLLGFRTISISGRVNPLREMLYSKTPIYLSYHALRIDFKVLTPLLGFGYERLNCLRWCNYLTADV